MKNKKNRPCEAADIVKKSKLKAPTKVKSIISKNDFYASALEALRAEEVENGSSRLTVFFTDSRLTGYTTGHSRSRRAREAGNDKR